MATRFVSWDGLCGARKVKPVVGMSTGKVGRAGGRTPFFGPPAVRAGWM
jgi:hypothetical protein